MAFVLRRINANEKEAHVLTAGYFLLAQSWADILAPIVPLKAPLLNHSIMTRKNQEDRRSHLLEKYRRIQRRKTKGAPKGPKKQGFRVLKKTRVVTKPVAKPEAKRPAALAAVGDTIFISVAQFS